MATLLPKVDRQATTILEDVCAKLEQQAEIKNYFTAYVFGSVLAGNSSWADIDILLVVSCSENADLLRQALEPLTDYVAI